MTGSPSGQSPAHLQTNNPSTHLPTMQTEWSSSAQGQWTGYKSLVWRWTQPYRGVWFGYYLVIKTYNLSFLFRLRKWVAWELSKRGVEWLKAGFGVCAPSAIMQEASHWCPSLWQQDQRVLKEWGWAWVERPQTTVVAPCHYPFKW